jgi:hypothetical protein
MIWMESSQIDALVMGEGVIGRSIAYHLTRRRLHGTLLDDDNVRTISCTSICASLITVDPDTLTRQTKNGSSSHKNQ